MKLRNKKTGEVRELPDGFFCGDNLKKICEEWEDYEEPKEYWYIDYDGGILCGETDDSSAERMMISIGNHFESLEEAEKAVEKLKALKRLKDKRIKFNLDFVKNNINYTYRVDGALHSSTNEMRYIFNDLYLLFGGEE